MFVYTSTYRPEQATHIHQAGHGHRMMSVHSFC